MTKFYSDIKVCASLNENSRHDLAMGVDVGRPDLELWKVKNNIVCILMLELKTKENRLGKTQKKWNEEFDAKFAKSNCARAVAYGLQDARQIIANWHVALA